MNANSQKDNMKTDNKCQIKPIVRRQTIRAAFQRLHWAMTVLGDLSLIEAHEKAWDAASELQHYCIGRLGFDPEE